MATHKNRTPRAMNLGRPVQIFLSKNGVFQFARQGTKEHAQIAHGSLPCASVNTISEAKEIQTATCRLSYDGKFFLYYPFDQTLEGLERAGEQIERLYRHCRSGARGWPAGWSA